MIIACDFFALINRKAEVFTVFRVQNRIDCKVVQSAENAFFCYAQNAGEKPIGQVFVIFQPTGKQVAHKSDDFVVKALDVSLLDRRIVFVDDNNRRNTVIFVKHHREICQCHRQLNRSYRAGENFFYIRFFVLVEHICAFQFAVA